MSSESSMNGVFAINKPAGITSAKFLSKVQYILTNSSVFSKDLARLQGAKVAEIQKSGQKASRRKLRKVLKVKMGHGGTLDPLATGVLVIGVNKGTKKLQNYLSGSIKSYETEALFGASTTTGDIEGELLTKNATSHITKEELDKIPFKFVGHLKQTPPIFAALKMNGKPLYEYAREGIPLPKQIEPREVQIYNIEMFDDSLSTTHDYKLIKSNEEAELQEKLSANPTLNDDKLYFSKEYAEAQNIKDEEFDIEPPMKITEHESSEHFKPPLLHFKAQVSSGTYIRSLISDIGKALRSSAYMVKLIRTQQAEWELGKNVFDIADLEDRNEEVWGKVLSEVFEKGGENIDDISLLFDLAEKEYKESLAKSEALPEESTIETENAIKNEDDFTSESHSEDTSVRKRSIDQVEV